MDIKIVERPAEVQVTYLEKASATVLEEGQFCTLDANKLAIEAVDATAKGAYILEPAPAGTTKVAVLNDERVRFKGTGDAVFAETMRDTEVDLIVTAGVHLLDVGASATDFFRILPGIDAGVVGSAADINFYINNTL